MEKYLTYVMAVMTIVSQIKIFTPVMDKETKKGIVDSYKTKSDPGVPWIVYSDKANNPTYHHPHSNQQLKEMNFLEPFLVLRRKGDYFKIASYNPGLLGKFMSLNTLRERKSVNHYGWVHKSQLVLNESSIKDSLTALSTKMLLALQSREVIDSLDKYTNKNLVHIYNTPETTISSNQISSADLYSIVYPYKYSENGEHVLIGRTPYLGTDSIKTGLMGWVPKQILAKYGEQLFIEPQKSNQFPSFSTHGTAVEKINPFTENYFPFEKVPVMGFGKKMPLMSSKGDEKVSKTALLTHLYNFHSSTVYNLNGDIITYDRYLELVRESKNLNVVYVVETSEDMSKDWSILLNTVQNLRPIFRGEIGDSEAKIETKKERKIFNLKTGVIFYSQATIIDRLPLTENYDDVIEKFRSFSSYPADLGRKGKDHSVLKAIEEGLHFLSDTKDQTNIIVMMGTCSAKPDKEYSVSYTDKIQKLMGKTEVRIFGLQTYAGESAAYNDYVLQAKKLVLNSGAQNTERKKEKIANGKVFVSKPQYVLSEGDENAYRLDFPKNSMVPGWVLFPRKNKGFPHNIFLSYADSLMNQIRWENKLILTALLESFKEVTEKKAIFNNQINQFLTDQEKPILDISTAGKAADFPFLLEAHVALDDTTDAQQYKHYLLLTKKEIEIQIRVLENLIRDDLDLRKRGSRWLYRNNFIKSVKAIQPKLKRKQIREMPFNKVLKILLGLPPKKEVYFQGISLDNFLNRYFNFEKLKKYLKQQRDFLKRIPLTSKNRFESNKQIYYWVEEVY